MRNDRLFRGLLVLTVIGLMVTAAACGGPAPTPTPVPAPKATEPPKPVATTAPAAPTVAPTKPPAPTWPTKDITLIVPFSPGGGFDLQSRIFAPLYEKNLPLKASVVVVNQKGAGGNIGSLALIKSAPNGYTIAVLSPATLAQAQVTGGLEGYDIRKLVYIGQLSYEDGAVVVSTASGIKTVADLKTRELRWGVTTDSAFAAALMAKNMGLKIRQVMFDGGAEQALAAMRGDIDIMVDSISAMKRAVDNGSGKVAPLFVIADKRDASWSTVPSTKELGLDLGDIRYIAGSARVLAGPAGIPDDVAKAMLAAANKAFADPDFKAGMEKAGFTSAPASGDEAAKTVAKIVGIYEQYKDILASLTK